MSLKARGKSNPFYGRKHSSASKKKQSRSKKGKNNPMYGRRHSKKTIAKIRAAKKKK